MQSGIMNLSSPILTPKEPMKAKTPAPEKAPREPRIDCRQTHYSAGAIEMMEQATGIRLARPPAPFKAPTPAKDDE